MLNLPPTKYLVLILLLKKTRAYERASQTEFGLSVPRFRRLEVAQKIDQTLEVFGCKSSCALRVNEMCKHEREGLAKGALHQTTKGCSGSALLVLAFLHRSILMLGTEEIRSKFAHFTPREAKDLKLVEKQTCGMDAEAYWTALLQHFLIMAAKTTFDASACGQMLDLDLS